jgi:hypothetical protein
MPNAYLACMKERVVNLSFLADFNTKLNDLNFELQNRYLLDIINLMSFSAAVSNVEIEFTKS